MAIKNIIAKGIGFSPGSVKWIPVHGFGLQGAATISTLVPYLPLRGSQRHDYTPSLGSQAHDYKQSRGSLSHEYT